MNGNTCVHTANQAACHAQQFCDPVRGCLDKLSCSGPSADSICERLNVGIDACDGLWKCDTIHSYCVEDPKACGDRPNAISSCMASGKTATCAWMCGARSVDLNGDLNSPGLSNGCECTATDATDRPTLEMLDKNCDGIVGNVEHAVFVATSGNDAQPGTREKPKRSIAAGVQAAQLAEKDVYIAAGTYREAVQLVSGVSLFGGYDETHGWSRALGNQTRIESPTQTGVQALGIDKPTEIQLITVVSADATGDGTSSYAVTVINGSGEVMIRGCTLSPGAGSRRPTARLGPRGRTVKLVIPRLVTAARRAESRRAERPVVAAERRRPARWSGTTEKGASLST